MVAACWDEVDGCVTLQAEGCPLEDGLPDQAAWHAGEQGAGLPRSDISVIYCQHDWAALQLHQGLPARHGTPVGAVYAAAVHRPGKPAPLHLRPCRARCAWMCMKAFA